MKQKITQNLEKPIGPLADRMRPKKLEEMVGQEHLVGNSGILRTMLITDRVSSVIFWGPPGVGKTTLAQLIAEYTKSRFVKFSAVTATLDDIRRVVREARELHSAFKQRTILFVDEIHRFNKLQQDAFLPTVEDGTIILIGATTENPSFEIISPLLSRTKVFLLKPLEKKDLQKVLQRALTDKKRGLGEDDLKLDSEAGELIVSAANGDLRTALNILEDAAGICKNKNITRGLIEQFLQHQIIRYDKKGDEHYNTISAFIKSMRGSDPNAALYYLMRMLEGGEDPKFIARRMIVFASEDVGMADPQALPLAAATVQAVDFVGMPEARINLAHCATYLATAKKSNAAYTAGESALSDVKETLNEPIPLHILNAPTKLMKNIGYGKGYKYPHNYQKDELKGTQYLPDKLKDRKYYKPKI
ncbi:MAG: AAA family ATPase [Candidatus Doudnabacteria bacterium CG10_big_fil_rev_8_21_14_0_10_41_10]|uniref:Replication-associated recombination protein A n=1 Tax=Candidatus Doudnabacteria bacterium CG10_big_fil_rev_8_21_14_0_10_41_10 TaxID=1974551 RepID=A0A2H0VER9_9BACT|nr:MAG: AAA family ATPase [Candidatus Doudnabacteria bacterium CG10_big_fil_rev_8_21_14_0_10_41_10]